MKPVDVDLDSPTIDYQAPAAHPPNTPLVIYATATAIGDGSRGVVHYLTRNKWRQMPMKRSGDGFAATIPCDAVSQSGSISYYIEIIDASGNAVVASGSEDAPYTVPIQEGAPATAHLPDAPPPAACHEKPEREEEEEEAEEEEPECDAEHPCGEKESKPPAKPSLPTVWLSVTLAQDVQLATGSDICARDSQLDSGYSCFRQQGSQYLGTPQSGSGGQGAGVEIATTRALAGIDLAIADTLTVGARVGYAFRGGGPKPAAGSEFLPLHAEGRLSLWFAKRAYHSEGISPFALAAFGIGQIDSSSTVTVKEDLTAPRPTAQLDNPASQDLDAWKKSGVGFAALGGGVFIPVGSTHGVLGELRGSYLFPSPGVAFTLSIGYALGL